MATAKQRLEFVHGSGDDHAADIVNAINALDMMAVDGVWTEERLANVVAHWCGGHHITELQVISFLLLLFGEHRQKALDALHEAFVAPK